MHAAKIILLLLLTLAAMRGASWSVGWVLKRFARMKSLWIAVISNAVSLGVFACVLVTQRMPGEFIDLSALGFGVVVFTVCAAIDSSWTTWGISKPTDDATS